MKLTFTITIDAPDDARISLDSDQPTNAGIYTPPFEESLIPQPPEVIPLKGDIVNELAAAQVTPFRGAATVQPVANPAFCPIHNQRWKSVPAGVSKKTGKPYDAFYACQVQGCDQRPPRGWAG